MIGDTGRRGRLSPSQVRARERELEAVELRSKGLTFDEIAHRLGYSDRSAARKAVQRRVERDAPEAAGLRERLLDETEAVGARLWPQVDRDEPDVKAAGLLLKSIDLRARLGGVYRPESQPTVVNVVEVMIAELEERGRGRWAARVNSSTATASMSSAATAGTAIAVATSTMGRAGAPGPSTGSTGPFVRAST